MIEMRVPLPAQLTMSELLPEVRRETALFQCRQATDDCYSYELFRRVIVLRDEWAWVAIYELYNPVVSSWILPLVSQLKGVDLEVLVNEAFARFAHAMTTEKWRDFACARALLGYLKRCAKSAATDYLRWRHPRRPEDSLEAVSQEPLLDDFSEAAVDRLAAQELWAIVCREAPSPEERLILALNIMQGMPPRTLQRRYPTVFPHVQNIYHVRRNVLDRLQRNRELRRLLRSQGREVLL